MRYGSKISASIVLSAIFLTVFVIGVQASPGSMSRTISPGVVQPGGIVTVTLTVDVVSGERYYIIDETPPAELTIEDIGELVRDASDHLKMVQLQDAADKTYTYTMKAPSEEGTYTFSGIYQVDGMDTPGEIAGASTVTVSSAPAMGVNTVTILAAVIVVVLVLVVAYLFFKK
jgi:hypothetical protein